MMDGCLYRFRIFPSELQEEQILKTFKACEYLYKYFYKLEKDIYIGSGYFLDLKTRRKILSELKKEENHSWLKNIDSNALCSVLKDITENGFSSEGSNRCKNSYSTINNKNINISRDENCIQLPRLGKVRCKLPKNINGEILTVTVDRTPFGQYYVGVFCKNLNKTSRFNHRFVDVFGK